MVDPVIRKRNRANKRNGATYEIQLVAWLRSLGHRAERRSKAGSRDEGDVALEIGEYVYCIEAKNVAKVTLPEFLAQAHVQANHYAENRSMDRERVIPLVVIKRRLHGIEKSYVVQELDAFLKATEAMLGGGEG